jgi:hypothetical protein
VGASWQATITAYVTAVLDNLSSYFFYSTHSKRMYWGRKWMRGMRIGGKFARENGQLSDSGLSAADVEVTTGGVYSPRKHETSPRLPEANSRGMGHQKSDKRVHPPDLRFRLVWPRDGRLWRIGADPSLGESEF